MLNRTPKPEGHCASYYAATVNSESNYPTLEGDHSVDVCVVGGGFSGVSCALTLAERGYKVALVEANKIGWGASGRNGGQLIGGMSGSPEFRRQFGEDGEKLLWSIHYRGNEIVEERVEKYGIDCDLKRGWISVANKPSHMKHIEDDFKAHEKHGLGSDMELLDREALSKVLATDAYHGGLVYGRNGHLHPLNLCIGEANAASNLGVAIFEGSPVTAIEHGEKPVVSTARGRVTADTVILAGGAYHLLSQDRLNGLLFPTGSYIVATEPLGELADEINPRDLAVCDTNLILDYYRLSADKRMLYGGRCNYSNREPRDIAGSIRPRMVQVFPQLSGKKIDYAWGGKIGIIINRVPAIGRLEPNVFYLQGYSGHGVNFAHVASEIVADAVAGTMERFDVFERVKHVRIPTTRWLGNQLLALGMSYYRLRDLMS